ncbi:MAG: hypothetical protein GF401_20730 [Chitinivibrionales bacterium]|nr:hypothetical protein [Chitinivibrionales bacterium]
MLYASTGAVIIDTSFFADGTPGPYSLGQLFVDTSSVEITLADSAYESLPPYTWVEQSNGILFSEPIDSGIVIRVQYTTRYTGLHKLHYLYRKSYIDTTDTSLDLYTSIVQEQKPLFAGEELSISGYQSVGVSVGNLGGTHFEQALDVSIFGEIAPQTELKGHLSDQGSTLEGATREISEIDMIYLTLTNPRYQTTVGDQFITWPSNSLLFGEKKIKGLSAQYTPKWGFVKGFGALSGGKYAVQNVRGQNGIQGPYYLTGSGEDQIITPIGGTVDIWVNGEKLIEGEEYDYTVDYDLGTVTFTSRYLIKQDDLIRIEYEYRTFDYQRNLAGTMLGGAFKDSLLTVGGAFWFEADNKHAPIELDLSPTDKGALLAAGDEVYLKPMMSRPIHPNDADSVNLFTPVYVMRHDSSGTLYFQHVDPDTAVSDSFYTVRFPFAGSGQGEYDSTTVCPQADAPCYTVHRYVGTGGDFTPKAPLPAPARTMVGEIKAAFRPSSWLSATVDIAGQEHDRNLYSDKDDGDNTGAATDFSLTLGEKRVDRASLWLSGNHRLVTRRFTRDILTSAQTFSSWNDSTIGKSKGGKRLWETRAGGTIVPNITAEIIYGQLRRNDSLLTDKITATSSVKVWDHYSLTYSGNYFRHLNQIPEERSRRDNVTLLFDFDKTSYSLFARDEWRTEKDTGRGLISGGAEFMFKPFALKQKFTYASHRKGNREVVFAPDTGYSILWEQSLDHSFLPNWKFTGSSSHHRYFVEDKQEDITTLVNIASDIARTGVGFSSKQEYSVSSEKASRYIQIPRYRGAGFGSYTIDTTGSGDKYVPDQLGEWEISERQVYDTTSDSRVRKTNLRIAWSLLPSRDNLEGILADLEWKGIAGCEEHIKTDRTLSKRSWIPAYATLSGSFADSIIQFSDLYYHQTLDWYPGFTKNFHAQITGKPFIKKFRGYKETGFEWGLGADKSYKKLFFGFDGEHLLLDHKATRSSGSTFTLNDLSVEFTEKYRFFSDFDVYLRETIGRTRRTTEADPNDGGIYFNIKPGVSWHPFDKGWAEASYTFSYVDAGENLDYRMANGFANGYTHLAEFFIDIRVGKHFSVGGSYRGEVSRGVDEKTWGKAIHALSTQVKAFL